MPFLEAFKEGGLPGVRRLQSLGNPEKAFRELENVVRARRKDLIFLRVYPQWAPLRDDPRFEEIATKIGLPLIEAK